MNRGRLALFFGVLVAVGAAVTFAPSRYKHHPVATRVFDRRCRGGCTDTALLRILPGGSGPIATGSLSGSKGQVVTTTRASNKTCNAGTASVPALVYLTANQPCVESQGLLVEGASTNLLLWSEALDNAAWTKAATTTITANDAVAPDGNSTADQLAFTSTADYVISSHSTAAAVIYSYGSWARTNSGTTTNVRFSVRDFTLGHTIIGAAPPIPTLTTAWQYVCITTTAAAVAGDGVEVVVDSLSGAQTIQVWGEDLEASPICSSYIPTTVAAASRAADVVSVANPVTGTSYCAVATFTPESGAAWTAGSATRRILGFGAVSNANSSRVEFGSDSSIHLYTFDGTATIKDGPAAQSFVAGSSHRLLSCNLAGTLSQSFDGVAQSVTPTGAGTGVVAAPATLYLGDSSGIASGGYLSDICVGNAVGQCR